MSVPVPVLLRVLTGSCLSSPEAARRGLHPSYFPMGTSSLVRSYHGHSPVICHPCLLHFILMSFERRDLLLLLLLELQDGWFSIYS